MAVRPLILNEGEIASVAPSPAEIIAIVADTYASDSRGEVEVPSKIGVHPDFTNSFLHAMPAWVRDKRALGMKWVSYFPGNAARGLPDSTGIIVLNDPDCGLPVAIMEGMWVTYARTTACAAVMARHLLQGTSPRVMTLIGCGGLGRWSLTMLSEVFPGLEEVRVFSRNTQSRVDFCRRHGAAAPFRLVPADGVETAVAGADLVVSSIPPPPAPLIEPGWLAPGALAVPLDHFHCYTAEAIAECDFIVTDDMARIRRHFAGGNGGAATPPLVSFADLLAGRAAVETGPGTRAMALPSGIASVDMTVAWEIFRRASQARLGTSIDLTS